MTKQQRLTYIDTAKGLLILLMIWYHTPPAVAIYVEGCNPYMGGGNILLYKDLVRMLFHACVLHNNRLLL